MRKIEVTTVTPTELELEDTVADIQRMEERKPREGAGRETTEGGEEKGGQEGKNSRRNVPHGGGSDSMEIIIHSETTHQSTIGSTASINVMSQHSHIFRLGTGRRPPE